MKDGKFTEEEREYLSHLPAVSKVSEDRIYYTDAFRDYCLRVYHRGESPSELFRWAGLDPKVIGYKRVERAFARWRSWEASQTAASPETGDEQH
ncbi:HTH domain-containing protein [Bifidobacterium simiarum]|uniref:Uncharacterized protein n=1 Tax=Bifidobacterium simiarum TaxID=2045441 RepID=A0A2M9HF53_9BIFI|nr:HTH domain-containing protein [Bifidobacterium simiarum]PJM75433.1 hypothetical protein CSQ87_05360 [Bifidobacterium simiarum]